MDNEVSIIFTTTSLEHGIESYQVDATYYIVKPIDKDELNAALKKCQEVLDLYAKSIEVMENRQLVKIRLRDIRYVEAMKHNSILHTEFEEIKVNMTFKELADMLGGYPFIRCHRSYVVNLLHVTDIIKNDLLVNEGERIPISKTYQEYVQKSFKKYFWDQ